MTILAVTVIVFLSTILKAWIGFGSAIAFMMMWTAADIFGHPLGNLEFALSAVNMMHVYSNVPLLYFGFFAMDWKLLAAFLPGRSFVLPAALSCCYRNLFGHLGDSHCETYQSKYFEGTARCTLFLFQSVETL